MTEHSDRFRRFAATFTDRVEGVPEGRWDDPAPCEGWVARDVVRHLCDWVPGLIVGAYGLPAPAGPSVDDDPVGAWAALRRWIEAGLDDPEVADREADLPPGRMALGAAVDMLVTGDVFLHTWDLARATGQDETLDPDEVHRALEGMLPLDEVLRQSGHYGPKVEVPADADEQTRLLAFIGRRP
jgi:uncharacterized protein (TIGR03086 family)